MSWRLVDGVQVPDAVSGHPALDFCNTRAGWGTSAPKEYLVSDRAFAVWARESALLDAVACERVGDGKRMVEQARRLRDALYACLTEGPGHARDWQVINDHIAKAASASRLVPVVDDSNGLARWVLDDTGVPAADLPLLAVAAAVADLLTSPLSRCVSACPGAGCGWLFADPRRRRRWCSMAVCGNRAKARRFADRQRRDDPQAPEPISG